MISTRIIDTKRTDVRVRAARDAIQRSLRHSELLEDPVEQGDGLWLGLVAVTPWGPLVRMEFGLSETSP